MCAVGFSPCPRKWLRGVKSGKYPLEPTPNHGRTQSPSPPDFHNIYQLRGLRARIGRCRRQRRVSRLRFALCRARAAPAAHRRGDWGRRRARAGGEAVPGPDVLRRGGGECRSTIARQGRRAPSSAADRRRPGSDRKPFLKGVERAGAGRDHRMAGDSAPASHRRPWIRGSMGRRSVNVRCRPPRRHRRPVRRKRRSSFADAGAGA